MIVIFHEFTYAINYLCICTCSWVFTIQKFQGTSHWFEIPHPFNIHKPMQEKKDLDMAPRSRKRPLAQPESSASKYFKPSVVNREFFQFTDQLNELMQFYDPDMIMEHCSSLMASDVHNIPVFPTEVAGLQSHSIVVEDVELFLDME